MLTTGPSPRHHGEAAGQKPSIPMDRCKFSPRVEQRTFVLPSARIRQGEPGLMNMTRKPGDQGPDTLIATLSA